MRADRLDLLLFHAWFLNRDPHEQEIMRPFPPLGMMYLVSYLRRAGFGAVDLFDATFADGPADFAARLEADRPRVVGLYGHTVTRPMAATLLGAAVARGCRTIAGGPDPVQYLDEYFDAGVEVVVIGEGERTVEALLGHLAARSWTWDFAALAELPGIAFRVDGRIVRTRPQPLIRPLDQIPWPHRDRRDLDAYLQAWRARHGETALSMVTSRGCPYHCSWCSKQVYGDSYRRRSVEDVLAELRHVVDSYGPDQVWFADDLFTINKAWVRRFCAAKAAQGPDVPFYLIGRPESLDADLVGRLAGAGLRRMYISAESGAQHILDAMQKHDRVENILRAGRLLHAHGVELGVFVMLGYPGERMQDVEATLKMLHALQPEVTLLSVAHPMKGTTFYESVKDRILPASPTETSGRLRYTMDLPAAYYELAKKLIFAETELVGRLRRGQFDGRTLLLAARAPLLRAQAAITARSAG